MLNRSVAPSFEEVNQISLPEAEHCHLSNGVSLYMLPGGTQPVLRLELMFKAGKSFESKAGISFFTCKMLAEGTKGRSSSDIANEIDKYGAFLDFEPGNDLSVITLYTLSKHLEKSLALIKELVEDSIFSERELDIKKAIKIQEIKLAKEKNNLVASKLFKSSIFGARHPYGSTMSIAQVRAIMQEDLIKFARENFTKNLKIILSGQIDDDTISLINNYFGVTDIDSASMPTPKSSNGSMKNQWISKENSLQSSLKIGKKFISMGHEDYQNVLVTNEILGGYFGSRLMKNIREEKGYTYGIYSGIGSLLNDSFFVISTDVKKEHAQDTVNEIFKEIDILQNHLVSQEELSTVKNYMRGTFLSDINTPFKIADKFKSVHLQGLDMQYYKSYFKTIDKIEPSTIREMAQKYFVKDSFVEVIVG